MSLVQALNDPNLQKFITPLIAGLVGILGSWVGNQLPPLKNENQGWRRVKLAIEVAILAIVLPSWTDAMKAFSGNDASAQVAGSAYGVVLLLLLGAILADVWQLVKPSPTSLANREAAQKRKSREALMANVRHRWIYSVLEAPNSLNHRSRIELGLQERPNLVRQLQSRRAQENWRSLPLETQIFDEFVKLGEGGTLLIVGEPGGGKTTLLLELARDLLSVTNPADPEQALPVVLNLSSWGRVQVKGKPVTTLKDWLVEELFAKYTVPPEVGEAWLNEESLILLLDGLDEVEQSQQDECIAAINRFQQEHGTTEIVVCCRVADYEKRSTGLTSFREAVYVLPLDLAQVDDYLQQAGAPLEEFRAAVQQDTELQKMVNKPLFLAIASLAYKDRPAAELLLLSEKERLRVLFDRYIEEMFVQRPLSEREQRDMIRWLSLVAKRMGSEKEFLIERMQPIDWLRSSWLRWKYWLTVGLTVGLISGLMFRLMFGLMLGLIGGLGFGLVSGLSCRSINVFLVETLQISRLTSFDTIFLYGFRSSLISALSGGLIGGLIIGLSGGLVSGLMIGLIIGLIVGLGGGLSVGLIAGLKADIQERTYANQGVWNSRNNMVLVSIVSLAFTPLLYLLLANTLPLDLGQSGMVRTINSVIWAPLFLSCIFAGGLACIQHFALRLVLYRAKLIYEMSTIKTSPRQLTFPCEGFNYVIVIVMTIT